MNGSFTPVASCSPSTAAAAWASPWARSRGLSVRKPLTASNAPGANETCGSPVVRSGALTVTVALAAGSVIALLVLPTITRVAFSEPEASLGLTRPAAAPAAASSPSSFVPPGSSNASRPSLFGSAHAVARCTARLKLVPSPSEMPRMPRPAFTALGVGIDAAASTVRLGVLALWVIQAAPPPLLS